MADDGEFYSGESDVEYTLVPAEVVNDARRPPMRRKRTFSVPQDGDSEYQSSYRGPSRGRGRGRGGLRGGRGRGRGRGRGGMHGSGPFDMQSMMAAMMETMEHAAPKTYPLGRDAAVEAVRKQIAFYFSANNLAQDVFLRQFMDVDGFVPVVILAQFRQVALITNELDVVREAIRGVPELELDEENDKVRVHEGWAMWLMPNAEGGFGVPRYVKHAPTEEEAGEEGEVAAAAATTGEGAAPEGAEAQR